MSSPGFVTWTQTAQIFNIDWPQSITKKFFSMHCMHYSPIKLALLFNLIYACKTLVGRSYFASGER